MPDHNLTKDPRHIFTVNVEDYFQVGAFEKLIQKNHWDRFETRLKINTEAMLVLLEEFQCQATFFTSGWIANNYPELLRGILAAGHEVASQGYHQRSFLDLPPKAFQEDIRRSKAITENAIGAKVQGFRIGRGWMNPLNLWALAILAEEGYQYDSSLCAIGRQFFHEEYRAKPHQHCENGQTIWEVPVSSVRFSNWSMPFAGGNYVRQLPDWVTRRLATRWVNRNDSPLVMYFHIWELDAEQPRLGSATWLQKIRHYRNLPSMRERICYFLQCYSFTSIAEYLGIEQDTYSNATPPACETEIERVNISEAPSAIDMTIIVPCYNEQDSITYLSNTLDKFKSECQDTFNLRFIFVNDGSQDDTLIILRKTFNNVDSKIIDLAENRGIAYAIVSAFREVETKFVAVIDADCTFDPAQLLEMFEMMSPEIDVVSASPLHPQGSLQNVPFWRMTLSRSAAFLYRQLFNQKLSSYTSCFRIYRTHIVKEILLDDPGFCGVTEILARLDIAGHQIVEYPAKLETRLLGTSKIKLMKTIASHLRLTGRLILVKWFNITLQATNTPDI